MCVPSSTTALPPILPRGLLRVEGYRPAASVRENIFGPTLKSSLLASHDRGYHTSSSWVAWVGAKLFVNII